LLKSMPSLYLDTHQAKCNLSFSSQIHKQKICHTCATVVCRVLGQFTGIEWPRKRLMEQGENEKGQDQPLQVVNFAFFERQQLWAVKKGQCFQQKVLKAMSVFPWSFLFDYETIGHYLVSWRV
jgi:hypothetical protein